MNSNDQSDIKEKTFCCEKNSSQMPLANNQLQTADPNEYRMSIEKDMQNNDGNNDKLAANECNGSPKKKVFLSFGIDQILSKEYKERNSIGLYTTESGYTTGSLIRSSLDHQNLARSTMERLITENNQDTINEECIEVNPLQPDYRNSLSKEVEYVTKLITGKSAREKYKRTKFTDFQRYRLKKLYRKTEYPEHNEIEQLARNMNLSVHNIKVWFQNRRSRRKKAVESDFSDNDSQPIFINPKALPHIPISRKNSMLHQSSKHIQQMMNQNPHTQPPYQSIYSTTTPFKYQKPINQSRKQISKSYISSSEDELRKHNKSDGNI